MKGDSRTQPLAMVAVAFAALLLASLWMQWSSAGFDDSTGFLSAVKVKSTGWEIHDALDIVIAVAAGIALLSNVAIAAGGGRGLAGVSTLFAGVVAGGAVASTMIDPPIPELFERFNELPGVPDIQFDPAYGLFAALAASIVLILVGILQMTSGGGTESPTPPPVRPSQLTPSGPLQPDPFAKTPPPPDPFSKGPGSAPPPTG